MNVLNIADLDKTLTDHETSAYNWLLAQSDSIEEQRKIALTDEFKQRLAGEKVARWIETLAYSNADGSNVYPIATLIPTGRWKDNAEVTEYWLCRHHLDLISILGMHVEIKYLCFKDYEQYLRDKFFEMRSWLGRVIQYYALYSKQLQINVYDDTFDVAVRASEMTFAGHPFNVVWVHDGVPKRLFVADKPKEKESWVSML
jgi:hypothetical protein